MKLIYFKKFFRNIMNLNIKFKQLWNLIYIYFKNLLNIFITNYMQLLDIVNNYFKIIYILLIIILRDYQI